MYFSTQVRHDLGICLRGELVAFLFELLLEFQVVFDDAVVDDNDFALAVAVGVRIFLGRPAMRGPARVAQAVDSIYRMMSDGFLEISQLARMRDVFPFSHFR